MGKIISIVNQKGGVGKTTSTINLAASLGKLKKNILLVDLDPQGNATTGVGINKGDLNYTIHDVIIGNIDIKKTILKTKEKNFSIIPANIDLAGVDIELLKREQEDNSFLKSMQLKTQLNSIRDNYDFIFIDCPPSLGMLTSNALAASDSVIIPVQCEFFALEGIMQLVNTVILTQKNLNPNLDIEGVLLTMYDSRTLLGYDVIKEIKSYFKERVYDTIIPRNVRLAEAPSHGKSIIAYDLSSKGGDAYMHLAKEVILRNEK
ncbi:MAG: ParA family protein [Bacilli bacterium]